MRVFVSGDRNMVDPAPVKRLLAHLQEHAGKGNLLVGHGDAPGADTLADKLCLDLGIDRVRVPANWRGRGLSAGPFRNGFALDLLKPEALVYFHPFLSGSKGTRDAVEKARERGIPVVDGLHPDSWPW